MIVSREAEDDFYDITKPIEFKSKDVDDGFQHFWLPMIFMAMPGKIFRQFHMIYKLQTII